MSEAREAARGSGIRLATELVGRVLSLLTTFLLARGLEVTEFGVYFTFFGIAVVLAEVGDLGLQGLAVPVLIAGRFRLRDLLRAKLLLTAVLGVLALFLPWLLGGLAAGAALLLPGSWRDTVQAAGRDGFLLMPFVLYFGLTGWSEFLGVALRAAGRKSQEAAVILCFRAAGLLAVMWAIQEGLGLQGLVWAQTASVLPALLLGAWLLSRPTIGLPAAAASAVGSVLRAAAPLAVNGGLALLSLRIELIAIFFLRGSWEAGLFAAALKFVEALNGIPAALVSGALPSLTREALGGAGRSRQVRARTAAMLALLGVPAAFGMVLQAPAVLGLLGSEYTPGARSLRILAFAIAVLFTNTLLVNALIAVGRADRLPRLTGVRVGVAVLLALALVPTLGGPGAAIGFLIAELVLTAMAARGCVAADFPVPVLRSVLLAALLSLPMAAAVGLLRSSAWVAIGVGVVVYGVTLGTAWALGRDPLRRLLDGEQA